MRPYADRFHDSRWAACVFALLAGPPVSSPATEPLDRVSGFALPDFESGQTVHLDDFKGQIVILDFFAYWCQPCLACSIDLDQKTDFHYAENRANPHGARVHLISINVENEQRAQTARFIKRAGLANVLNDADGAVFKQYGGEALPFIVVLDGTSNVAADAPWRVLYRHSGYEGFDVLRKHIDSVTLPSPPSSAERAPTPPFNSRGTPIQTVEITRPPVLQSGSPPEDRNVSAVGNRIHAGTLELSSEFLGANDASLTESAIAYRNTGGVMEYGAALSHGFIDLDYNPNPVADLIGTKNDISDHRTSIQLNARHNSASPFKAQASGGYYEGFADYRSFWLDEYYRQQFSKLPGYQAADPRGANLSAGLRWEYLPTAGFLEVNATYQRDIIAPGYDRPLFQELERGRDKLITRSIGVTLENVLTSRIRSLLRYQLTDTTGRSLRQSVSGSLNWAVAENWVVRSTAGTTTEEDGFRSVGLGATLEYDIGDRWYLGLGGHYYRDNGDVENSLFVVSTAAPDLETVQATASLKWLGERASFRIEAGPYLTKYDAPDTIVAPFANLYSERDFLRIGIAFSRAF